MRVYQLTDRDFEDFFAIMEKIETENKLKHGDGPVVGHSGILDALRRTYRYQFLNWRSRVMAPQDSYFWRDIEAPREDTVKRIRWEIERLQKLLPEEK